VRSGAAFPARSRSGDEIVMLAGRGRRSEHPVSNAKSVITLLLVVVKASDGLAAVRRVRPGSGFSLGRGTLGDGQLHNYAE
jgi:hypothetical protein